VALSFFIFLVVARNTTAQKYSTTTRRTTRPIEYHPRPDSNRTAQRLPPKTGAHRHKSVASDTLRFCKFYA
jgi:hypothetical protein